MYANDYAKFRLTDKQNILRPCVLLTQRPLNVFPIIENYEMFARLGPTHTFRASSVSNKFIKLLTKAEGFGIFWG